VRMASGNVHHRAAPLLVLSLWGCSAPAAPPAKVAERDAPAAQARACSAEAEVKPAPSFGPIGNPVVVASRFDFPPAQGRALHLVGNLRGKRGSLRR
jgi:hypothetical protein